MKIELSKDYINTINTLLEIERNFINCHSNSELLIEQLKGKFELIKLLKISYSGSDWYDFTLCEEV